MRRNGKTLTALTVIALLTVIPVWARGGEENDSTSKGKRDSATSVVTASGSVAAPKGSKTEQPAAPGYAAEIEQLRGELAEQARLIKKQQERLDALTEELHAERVASSAPPAVQEGQQQASGTKVLASQIDAVAETTNQLGKKLTAVEGKVKGLGPFTFSGDLRLRGEPFFGGPADQSLVRDRLRYRLRFNVNAKLDNDISGGFSLASGDLNDPISTNQTTNQFYTRKAFAVDRAFVNYNPHYFKPLTLTGGKFVYPWYNTELVWDKDLNPEGLAQTLSWNFEEIPVLKKIAVVGFELPFAEVAGVSATNKSIVQSVVYGGQLQSVWQLAGWLKFSAYGGFYSYHNADAIAFALSTASLNNPQTPNSGLLRLNQNRVQNSITTVTKTTVVTANTGAANTPTALPTGVTSIQSAQFASKFGLLDAISRFDVKAPSERWPVAIIGDFVQNTRACANVDNILAAPANTATATYKAVNSVTNTATTACDPHQRRGYWLEGRFGRAQEKRDLQFAYTRMFIEREAVLGAFNASDIRQNSNLSQHRVEAIYQTNKNVQLAFTGYFGRPLASTESILTRLQFDLIYKF